MRICIRGGKVFDLRNNRLLDADAIVCGERIERIFQRQDSRMQSEGFDRVIDAKGCVLMPGFKNAHTHSPMTFFRSLADDLPLERWLSEVIFPFEAKLTGEDVFFGSLLAIMEYLKNGITACQDMYFFQDEVARAFMQAGVRCVINGSLTSDVKSPDYASLREEEAAFSRIMEENERFSSLSPLIGYAPGVHSTYTTSSQLLSGAVRATKRIKKGFYTHLNETRTEAENARRKFSVNSLVYLDSLGAFDFGGGIFHGVHMEADELDIMRRKGVGVAINACSNAKLCSGVANFEEYEKRGILVGLGTDGASSNNSLDMFKELWTLQATNHIAFGTADAPKPYDMVRAATAGSAKFMNLKDSMYVEEGQYADLTLIDISDANAVPFSDFCKFLAYSANPSNVRMTMVAGKVLYFDGKYDIGIGRADVVGEVESRLAGMRGRGDRP